MAELVRLNGPPGVGKSTVAHGLVARRALALDLARTHLEAGRDVVLPQLLVLDQAIDQVEAIASSAGAAFVEIILVAPADEMN